MPGFAEIESRKAAASSVLHTHTHINKRWQEVKLVTALYTVRAYCAF